MFTPHSPSNGGFQNHQADAWRVPMLLGELAAGQRHLIKTVDIIHDRLAEGDRRMAEHGERHARNEERITTLERGSKSSDDIPRWEKVSARWMAIVVPLIVLWATRSWEMAIKALALLK